MYFCSNWSPIVKWDAELKKATTNWSPNHFSSTRDLCLSSQGTHCVLLLCWRNTCRCFCPIHRPFIYIQSGQTMATIYGKLMMQQCFIYGLSWSLFNCYMPFLIQELGVSARSQATLQHTYNNSLGKVSIIAADGQPDHQNNCWHYMFLQTRYVTCVHYHVADILKL